MSFAANIAVVIVDAIMIVLFFLICTLLMYTNTRLIEAE